MALSNQWQVVVGFAGHAYTGLIFASIPEALEMAGVKKKQRRQVRQDLRMMEEWALPILNGGEPAEDE